MDRQQRLSELIVWGRNIGSDDDSDWTEETKNYQDAVEDELSSWGEDEPEYSYVQELRKKYEELSYNFSLNPVAPVVWAANIVTDLSTLFFRAFSLMIDNMRAVPSYNQGSYSSESGYENTDGGWEPEKTKEKTKTKKGKTKDKGSKEASGSEKTTTVSERDAEKSARQERAKKIREDNAFLDGYNKSVSRRAERAAAVEMGMSSEMAMKR